MNWTPKTIIMLALLLTSAVGLAVSAYRKYIPKETSTKVAVQDTMVNSPAEPVTETTGWEDLANTFDTMKLENMTFQYDSLRVEIEKHIPENNHENFWDFYYKFVSDEDFRERRLHIPTVPAEVDYIGHFFKHGDYIEQDSLANRWLYTLKYKNHMVTFSFQNKKDKWYLTDFNPL